MMALARNINECSHLYVPAKVRRSLESWTPGLKIQSPEINLKCSTVRWTSISLKQAALGTPIRFAIPRSPSH
jgi:hypothetical protein